jgi:hypothetical protein
MKASGSRTVEVEKRGSQSTLQMLREVLAYIETHKKVLDLNELCKRRAGTGLDAFAYNYEGNFNVQAEFGPRNRELGGINIHKAAIERDGEVVISKEFLIDPGREENAFEEKGPNNGKLTSSICIITSSCEDAKISLSCSYKYFTDMGGSWDEETKEVNIYPHSGNHQFFEGETPYWFKSMIFVTGVRGNLVMGTPLFLILGTDPTVQI